jgi:hypothetical protein
VRRELLEDKGAETLEIELGIGQKRLVTRPVGFGLSEQGFVGSRIDLREQSPWRTSWPSWKAIFCISPSTRTLTVTVL